MCPALFSDSGSAIPTRKDTPNVNFVQPGYKLLTDNSAEFPPRSWNRTLSVSWTPCKRQALMPLSFRYVPKPMLSMLRNWNRGAAFWPVYKDKHPILIGIPWNLWLKSATSVVWSFMPGLILIVWRLHWRMNWRRAMFIISIPNGFVTYGDQVYFDPALPESRRHICMVITDIVSRYDVDAIHMDDYFYPYLNRE